MSNSSHGRWKEWLYKWKTGSTGKGGVTSSHGLGAGREGYAVDEVQLEPEERGVHAATGVEVQVQSLVLRLLRRGAQVKVPGFHGVAERGVHALTERDAWKSAFVK